MYSQISGKDLEVFVLTYNRAKLLKQMLESLCNQTLEDFTIKVLDNASTDETTKVIEEIQINYPKRNIIHIKNEKNIGNYNNFKKTQQLASHEYTAVFHDDDIIHPEYLEAAIKLFNHHKNTVMVSSNVEYEYNPSTTNFHLLDERYFLWQKDEAVKLMLMISSFNFINIIYKTEAYKKVNYEDEIYGKNLDNAFLFNMSSLGDVIYISGCGARYRQHNKSDSNNPDTGPYLEELVALLKLAKEKMPQNYLNQYLLYNFGELLLKLTKIKNVTKKQFFSTCIDNNIFSLCEIKFFKKRLLKKLLNLIVRHYRKKYIKKTFHKKTVNEETEEK